MSLYSKKRVVFLKIDIRKTISTTKIPIDLIEPTPATGDSVTNITQNYATNSSPSFTGTATFESATLSSSPSATDNL